MDEPIVSRARIESKARSAFVRGLGRNDHGFNWHSTAAISHWQAEYDRCELEHKHYEALVQLCRPISRVLPP